MKAEIELSKLGPEKIKMVFENSKEKNTIFGTTFRSLIYHEWWFVKTEIPSLLQTAQVTRLVNTLLEREGADQNAEEAEVKDIIGVAVWVISEIKRIDQLEKEYLTPDPDMDMINAGVKELEQFGEQNTLDNLTGGDMTKEEAIKKLPYHRIFDRLRKNLIEGQIQKRLREIQEAKRKQKKPGQ